MMKVPDECLIPDVVHIDVASITSSDEYVHLEGDGDDIDFGVVVMDVLT